MTQLVRATPQDAYARVDFDARVAGARPAELVRLCYDRVIAALGSARYAHEHADNLGKSRALTRAVTALTALQLGISDGAGVGAALGVFYEGCRQTLLDSVLAFDPERIEQVRRDFIDIAQATRA